MEVREGAEKQVPLRKKQKEKEQRSHVIERPPEE